MFLWCSMRTAGMNVVRSSVSRFHRRVRIMCANSSGIYNLVGQVWHHGSGIRSSARTCLSFSSERLLTVASIVMTLLITGLRLIATGSSMAPTPPIIVKRAILTGHPYRVHKKVVTMRYMFFNREDIVFFKPVQLVSKQGRRGWIKEPLGTHGMAILSPD